MTSQFASKKVSINTVNGKAVKACSSYLQKKKELKTQKGRDLNF